MYYLYLLEAIFVLLILLIGAGVFYFLVRRWKKVNFREVLRALLIYILGIFLVCLIYSLPFLSEVESFSGLVMKMLSFIFVALLAFYFVAKRVLSLNLEKSLICFLVIVMIIFPFLNFIRMTIANEIIKSGIAESTAPVLGYPMTEISDFINAIFSRPFNYLTRIVFLIWLG